MSTMSNEEFERIYGRPPAQANRKKKPKIYWSRIIIVLIVFVLIIIGIVKLVKGIAGLFKSDDSNLAQAMTVSQSAAESKAEVKQLEFKVCIDPGHGDYDVGTTDLKGKRLEKDDDLTIGLKVQEALQEAGVEVIMTRSDDSFLSLQERCDFANDNEADLFVSLHRNAYDDDISGIEIWVHNKKPELDTTLAQNIMTMLDGEKISENRGVQYGYSGIPLDNYYVNAETHMPSCLIELGFMTNDKDNKLFDENTDAYAKAICDGIIKSAEDMGIIDKDGKRLITESMISQPKIYKKSSSGSETSSVSESNTDSSQIIYNKDEHE